MPKVGMTPVRQSQIIRAAIDSIHSDGIAQASLREIGRRANISPSLITHYFGSRSELYVQILRYLNRRLASAIVEALRDARSPQDRLMAIANANFAEEHFEPATVSAWFALWGRLSDIPELSRFQRIYERRLESNVRYAMRELVPAERVDEAVILYIAVVDGLWVKAAQPTSRVDHESAKLSMSHFIAMLLAHFNSGGR